MRLTCLGWLLSGLLVLAGTGRPPDLTAYPWLYRRDNRPLDPAEAVVELIAVGDVMLGRQVMAAPSHPLAGVASWLSEADVTLGNLESVIGVEGSPRPGFYADPARQPYRLHAPPQAVDALQSAGFDLLGLANNHALDFGPAGLAGALQRLQAAGITALGAGPGAEAATQPYFRQVGPLRLAFLAFNFVPDPAGEPAGSAWQPGHWEQIPALAAIAAAKKQAGAVIVSVHWGREYSLSPDPAQVEAAQAMLDVGADLIIGHHPHVAQGPAVVEAGRLALYSLGNFVFDQQFGETSQGLALRAFFDRQGLRAAQLLPVRAGPRSGLMSLAEAGPLLARMQPVTRQGFTCDSQICRPVDDLPPSRGSGLFWGGEIDLTGDGVPEKVRRVAEQAIIYHGGRGEALLALWKPDQSGTLRSQPFIIGYRRGIYRDLWGGSAVTAPIYEVELGDVDGDDIQELIVLEQAGQDKRRTVSVWDWHGWGFELRWRSPANDYRDLIFTPAAGQHPPLISVTVSAEAQNPD
ncbi:MAG: CapA family protein [Chloroflexota bacterium]